MVYIRHQATICALPVHMLAERWSTVRCTGPFFLFRMAGTVTPRWGPKTPGFSPDRSAHAIFGLVYPAGFQANPHDLLQETASSRK